MVGGSNPSGLAKVKRRLTSSSFFDSIKKMRMEADILMRTDGWYWFDDLGNLVGPYETRAEAVRAAKCDSDWYSDECIFDEMD